ncbi:MAG TPA: 4-hydroxy-tetrahydrodipicolinate reductase [Actinomycetes bacterium]|nr:4-hydroxy-tetrahydrodipicolinate reductase [Actinomycetes bacterium]
MRVGVLGATGRMGRVTCRAVLGAADLELTAAVAGQGSAGQELHGLVPEAPIGLRVGAAVEDFVDAKVEAVVDFSAPKATLAAARLLLPAGVHLVSGTTGLPTAVMEELRGLAGAEGNGNAVWAPNFALGAVLAQRFAAIAARYYQAVEVIELHHAGKADAPSGTAIRTARAIAASRAAQGEGQPGSAPGRELVTGARGGEVDGVRVHSVRLPGLVAHQEVIFGGQGEILTLRHDSLDLSSFMPAVLLSVRAVPNRPGLTVGLEPLLEL